MSKFEEHFLVTPNDKKYMKQTNENFVKIFSDTPCIYMYTNKKNGNYLPTAYR